MAIPPDSALRGVAACFSQPVSEADLARGQHLLNNVREYNCVRPPGGGPCLPSIEYRDSEGERDIRNHVYRWDATPYDNIFVNGFRSRRQGGVDDAVYYNLERYVNGVGRPLDSHRETNYAFISTTSGSRWRPEVPPGTSRLVYRYEIYAPGGINVCLTLGEHNSYPNQDEICFVSGIARQYIRSAQLFWLRRRSSVWEHTQIVRVDNSVVINTYFNPQSHPERPILINRPSTDYIEGKKWQSLKFTLFPPPPLQLKKLGAPPSKSNDLIGYYTTGVAEEQSYIDSAFRSSRKSEVYVFMQRDYVLLNYAPGSSDDYVVHGPLLISDGFQSLCDTFFAEYRIDCAFGYPGVDEAFIFSGNMCAKINYAPGTTNDRIIEGPKTIAQMFPFFKNTGFDKGLDAAFESTTKNEAYVFKGQRYALINFADRRLIAIRKITDGFRCLANTVFENGIGAAFASHLDNEAYLFKDKYYALLHFNPAKTDDYIIGGVKEILPNWPSLRNILPRKNHGLDIYEEPKPVPIRDQDD